MKQLTKLLRLFEELVFPPVSPCGLCRERPSSSLAACRPCLDALAISWYRQEIQGHPYFSLFPYQGLGRDLIHKLKFQNDYTIGHTFGYLLALAAREEPELAKVHLFLPVPLGTVRFRQRGFNQAALLADSMSEVWKRPICDTVMRLRETKPQSGLSVAKRKQNLRGAFGVVPGFNVQGKFCLIVDDVVTSGQTFLELARLIKEHGGHPLGVFLARTEIYGE